MFKKIPFFILALIILFSVVGCSSDSSTGNEDEESNSKEETINLTLASFAPTTHPFSVHAEQVLIEKMDELTNGKVQIEHMPAEQMGKGPDLFDLASDKVVDIAVFTPVYYPSDMKLSSILFGLPGLHKDTFKTSQAYNNLIKQSPILEEEFLNHGVRPLIAMNNGPFNIYTTGKEVKTPDDLKGLKIKAIGEYHTDMLDSKGAIPVNITVTDLFSALDRGVIDALHSVPVDVEGYGVADSVEYATKGLALGSNSFGLVINEEVYQELPEDVQSAFEEANAEIIKDISKVYEDMDQEVLDNFAEDGVKIHEITETEKKEWEDFYEEYTQELIKKADNDQFEQVLEQFEQELESLE